MYEKMQALQAKRESNEPISAAEEMEAYFEIQTDVNDLRTRVHERALSIANRFLEATGQKRLAGGIRTIEVGPTSTYIETEYTHCGSCGTEGFSTTIETALLGLGSVELNARLETLKAARLAQEQAEKEKAAEQARQAEVKLFESLKAKLGR